LLGGHLHHEVKDALAHLEHDVADEAIGDDDVADALVDVATLDVAGELLAQRAGVEHRVRLLGQVVALQLLRADVEHADGGPGAPAGRSGSTWARSPTRVTRRSGSAATACTAPATIGPGAWSPPIASSAICMGLTSPSRGPRPRGLDNSRSWSRRGAAISARC